MNKQVDERQKRLAQLKKEVTRRGFDRHASVLRAVSELPVEFQTPAVLRLAAREPLQRILIFPPQIQRGWEYVPKQALLFTQSGAPHLINSIWPDQEPRSTFFQVCDLMYMEISLILLYGFLDILAQGQDSSTRIGVEFNTVAWCLLTRPLQELLQAGKGPSIRQADRSQESPTMQRAIEELPVKFANGAKLYGILPGEHLENLVFQPGTRKRWLHVFRRPLTPNTLLLLTSHYVVLIREDLITTQGWIFTYIPRECIVEMKARSCDLCDELIIDLKRGNQDAQYKIFLASEALENWHSRWIRHGGQWKDVAN
jgi:hypothetical protein